MQNCSPDLAPIAKGDKLSQSQHLKNDLERKQMESIPYACVVGSLYAQACTHSNISFAVKMLGQYQSSPDIDCWKMSKKVMYYL